MERFEKTLKPVKVVNVGEGAAVDLTILARLAQAIADDVIEGRQVGLEAAEALHQAMADARSKAVRVEYAEVHGPEPRPAVPAPEAIELHLNTDTAFAKRHGAKVKALGGTYSSVRSSMTDTRFVTVPNTEEGRALANDLIRCYPGHEWTGKAKRTCVVFRGNVGHGGIVQYVRNNSDERIENAIKSYERAVNELIDEGHYYHS